MPDYPVMQASSSDCSLFIAQFCATQYKEFRPPRVGDVMRVSHPQSGIATTVDSWQEYEQQNKAKPSTPIDDTPWRPFASRTDFEFAEFAAEAHLSRPLAERLLRLVSRISGGTSDFSFKTYADLEAAWEQASKLHTPVSYLLHMTS